MAYQTKYHKTGQYRQAVLTLKEQLTFGGWDEEGEVVRVRPTSTLVGYVGTVKLHGTNANIVLHEDQSITLHSKENYLASITPDNKFEVESDNAGFAQAMFQRIVGVRQLLSEMVGVLEDDLVYPLKLSGEWCGQGVQKGVGVSFINKKSLFLFSVKRGDTNVGHCCFKTDLSEYGIYDIHDFGVYEVTVDINNPDKATVELGNLVGQVEAECPVAKKLGVTECLIGEGLVWTPEDPTLYTNTGLWFKTKGQKHSTSKVKKLVSADPEKLESIDKFIEYAVTQNRLEQGLENVELDVKNTGQFIGWVNRDILQEESDVMSENNLEMKDVGKYISQKARDFFMERL